MDVSTSKLVALLDFQKALIKFVNRNAISTSELSSRIADADVAIVRSIMENCNLSQVQTAIKEKTKRTIEREFTMKKREYK